MSRFLSALVVGLVGLISMTGGGTLAAFKNPSSKVRGIIQHLAAGTVFAGLVVDVLAKLLTAKGYLWPVIGGMLLGLASMMLIRTVMTQGGGSSLGVTIIADVTVDGLLMGLSISSGEATAILFTAALAPEMFLLGVTAVQEFGEQRNRGKTIGIAFSIGLAIVVGALIGAWVYSGPKSIAMAILGFGAIALSYLVTEELLREAHEISVRPWIAAMFFAGFIPFFIGGILFRG